MAGGQNSRGPIATGDDPIGLTPPRSVLRSWVLKFVAVAASLELLEQPLKIGPHQLEISDGYERSVYFLGGGAGLDVGLGFGSPPGTIPFLVSFFGTAGFDVNF